MRRVTVVLIPSSGHGSPWTVILPPYGSDRLTAPSRSLVLKRAQAALPEHLAALAAAGLDDPPAGGPAALARVQVSQPLPACQSRTDGARCGAALAAPPRTYTVVLEPDEESGAFTVTVPLLPGCITEGADRREALAMAAEAIGLVLEHMAAENEPLPEETRPPELATLTVARTRAMASATA